jgi:hypothetical protein
MNRLIFKALAWCIWYAGVCSASSITTCSVARWVAFNGDPQYEVAASADGPSSCSASFSTVLDVPGLGSRTLTSSAYVEINGLLPELDEYGSNMVNDGEEWFVGAYATGVTFGQRTTDELGLPGPGFYVEPSASASFDFFSRRYVVNNPRARRGGFPNRPAVHCETEGYGHASCGVSGLTWGIDDIGGPTVFQQSGNAWVGAGHGDGGEARVTILLYKPTIWDAGGNVIPESEWETGGAGDPVVTEPNTVTLIPAGLAVLLVYRRSRQGRLKRISSSW